jgi:hypothetical protein
MVGQVIMNFLVARITAADRLLGDLVGRVRFTEEPAIMCCAG